MEVSPLAETLTLPPAEVLAVEQRDSLKPLSVNLISGAGSITMSAGHEARGVEETVDEDPCRRSMRLGGSALDGDGGGDGEAVLPSCADGASAPVADPTTVATPNATALAPEATLDAIDPTVLESNPRE